MQRLLRTMAVIGAAAAAIGMTWSVPAGAAGPTFAITPNPAAAAPGNGIDLVLSVSGVTDASQWVGFIVAFGRSNLPPGEVLQIDPDPEDQFVTIDSTSTPVAGSLLGNPEPSFGLDLIPNEYGVACESFGGCVSVFSFMGLKGESGELLRFRMKLSDEMPIGSERLVSFSVNYTGVPIESSAQVFTVTAIPEPSTYHLLAAGLVTLLLAAGTRSLRGSSKVS